MKKYDISIIISGIRTENWKNIIDQLKMSCKRHSYEIIFCSTKPLPDALKAEQNIKHMIDLGCPSKCLQRTTTVSEAEMLAAISDDCVIFENSIDSAIDDLKNSSNPQKNIVALRYTEGPNFIADQSSFSPAYLHAKTHADI